LESFTVVEDTELYPYIIKETIDNPTINALFTFGDAIDGNGKSVPCISLISYSAGPAVGGKITLPAENPNGQKIKMINDMRGLLTSNNVEIYFAPGSEYTTIGANAFNGGKGGYGSLITIDLPSTITHIGESAFMHSEHLNLNKLPDNLISIGLNGFAECTNLTISKLPDSLTTLGGHAFRSCSNITVSEIPAKITKIPDYCFHLCEKIAISNFGLDGQTLSLGMGCFSGASALSVTALRFGRNVTISSNVTSEYAVFSVPHVSPGYENVQDVYYPSTYLGCETEEELKSKLFGVNRSIPNWHMEQN
jgi:hypothetical protein